MNLKVSINKSYTYNKSKMTDLNLNNEEQANNDQNMNTSRLFVILFLFSKMIKQNAMNYIKLFN